MMRFVRAHARWLLVVTFAIGMAWVEAACVYYLRLLVDRVQPYQANPLPIGGGLGEIELVREVATLVMLIMVGLLAGRTRLARLGYTAVAFGVWDIAYYAFLWLMAGWPASLFDWDILFLLPLPWWGPVLAPVSIALLMIVGGTAVTECAVSSTRVPLARTAPAPMLSRAMHVSIWLGVGLALYVFMADSLREVRQSGQVGTVLPAVFNWPVFAVAFLLMAGPVIKIVRMVVPVRPAGRGPRTQERGVTRDEGLGTRDDAT